jgi:glycerol-3-phosphate O-acyltransferase/dihydroxyacetone phosphate acyltransferase
MLWYSLKKLVATWRILVGLWIPKRFEIATSGLTQYTTPFIPPISPYIGKKLPSSAAAKSISKQRIRPRGPPSRRLVKHVLRARIEAARALSDFLRDIERSGVQVRASTHLARLFGGTIDPDARDSTGVGLGLGSTIPPSSTDPAVLESLAEPTGTEPEGVLPYLYPQGWRSGKEVVRLLRDQGANMVLLQESAEDEEAWALVSSDGEAEPEDMTPKEEIDSPLFIPSSSSFTSSSN